MWVEAFTGLRTDQFRRLLREVRERGGEGYGWGRPWRLPLAGRVLLVPVYHHTNLTMRLLAPLFGVSPATVCLVILRIGPLLALEPTRASQEPSSGCGSRTALSSRSVKGLARPPAWPSTAGA